MREYTTVHTRTDWEPLWRPDLGLVADRAKHLANVWPKCVLEDNGGEWRLLDPWSRQPLSKHFQQEELFRQMEGLENEHPDFMFRWLLREDKLCLPGATEIKLLKCVFGFYSNRLHNGEPEAGGVYFSLSAEVGQAHTITAFAYDDGKLYAIPDFRSASVQGGPGRGKLNAKVHTLKEAAAHLGVTEGELAFAVIRRRREQSNDC